MLEIRVIDLVGKNAISLQSGTKLNQKISPELLKGEVVTLDFEGVSLYASPFFNASIGPLLKNTTIENLLLRLKIIGLNEVGKDLLNHVIRNAIQFYGGKGNVTEVLDQSSVKKKSDE